MNCEPGEQVGYPFILPPDIGGLHAKFQAQCFEFWQRGNFWVKAIMVKAALAEINLTST